MTDPVDLRDGPVRLVPPDTERSTFDVTFQTAALRRVRLVAQHGAVGSESDGWSIVVRGVDLWITDRAGDQARVAVTHRSVDAPTTVTLHLTSAQPSGPSSATAGRVDAAFVDGRALTLRPTTHATWPYRLHAPDAVHPPTWDAWLGGFTDAAGGHDDLRFGVDAGDVVPHVAWTGGHLPVATPGRGAPTTARTTPPVDVASRWVGRWVFRPGEGGYTGFRIPGAVRTPTGALLAFAEGRVDALSDSCRTKHLVVKRSDDGGRTWGPLAVAARYAANPGDPDVGSVMNPSPLVDERRGRIALLHSATDAGEFEVAAGSGRHDLRVVVSDDDGRTFGPARSVSDLLGPPPNLVDAFPAWHGVPARLQIPTMGRSVCIDVPGATGPAWFVAGNVTFGRESPFRSIVRAFWSLDEGRTWTAGPAIARWSDGAPAVGLNETSVAVRHDGTIVAHHRAYRDGRPLGHRAATIGRFARDGSFAWGDAHPVPDLIEPGVQGSVLVSGGPRARTYACVPHHPRVRRNLTLLEERPGTQRWIPRACVDDHAAAYSVLVDLAPAPDQDLQGGHDLVGILYERGTDGGVAWATVDVGT